MRSNTGTQNWRLDFQFVEDDFYISMQTSFKTAMPKLQVIVQLEKLLAQQRAGQFNGGMYLHLWQRCVFVRFHCPCSQVIILSSKRTLWRGLGNETEFFLEVMVVPPKKGMVCVLSLIKLDHGIHSFLSCKPNGLRVGCVAVREIAVCRFVFLHL